MVFCCRLFYWPSLLAIVGASRIVAVGDLHGDLSATLKVLSCAGLVNADSGRWIGGTSRLVQLGDVLDRGREEAEIFSLLRSLRAEAAAAGGSVHTLLGNHEVLNVIGRAGPFIHASAQTSFGPDRVAAFAPGSELACELADFPVLLIIDDTAFVHAAVPPGATLESVARLNAEARAWLLGERRLPPRSLVISNGSPVWDRSYSSPSDIEPEPWQCDELRATLGRLGVSRMVVGHTPQCHVNCACDGLVWRCDTGMSAYVMDGRIEALEIADGTVRVLRGAETCTDETCTQTDEPAFISRDFF